VSSLVSVVLFANHGAVALRDAMHNLVQTTDGTAQIVVMARECREEVATYLTRQAVRGRIAGFGFDPMGIGRSHCGMDGAFALTDGEYIVRVQDDLRLEEGWLERCLQILREHPDIGCLGLLKPPTRRRRGRPPKPRGGADIVDSFDWRCFVTTREVFLEHERQLLWRRIGWDCPFQARLREMGLRVAYLPGQVRVVDVDIPTVSEHMVEMEAGLPVHGGAIGAREKLRQSYRIGDDVLLTCMSCGSTELEVLAARIEFCRSHDVPVGLSYSLRCSECHDVQYEEDIQFQCPA
jgi:hypothetical protein